MSDGLSVSYAGGGRWIVVDSAGTRISGFYGDVGAAEDRMARERKRRATRRRACLACGGGFLSEGNHNRMCERCRQMAAGAAV